MKIENRNDLLVLDFERHNARWILAVFDDRWDHVQEMICGNKAAGFSGLGHGGIAENQVRDYSNTTQGVSHEILLDALYFLPCLAQSEESIAMIVFSKLAPALNEQLRALTRPGVNLAAMIDVGNEAGIGMSAQQSFSATWRTLDETEVCPKSARCVFSRGGHDRQISAYSQVLRFHKAHASGAHSQVGYRNYLAHFQKWWGTVQGNLSTGNEVFQRRTTKAGRDHALHKPSTLPTNDLDSIFGLLTEMKEHDAFGSWRFCEASLSRSGVTPEFRRLWLAAKALQTCDSKSLPITGLIGMLLGLTVLRANPYDTDLPLSAVPETAPAIDSEEWLGLIPTNSHTPQDLAIALRDWINHEEQFSAGRAQVVSIALRLPDQQARLEIKYSDSLPEAVVSPSGRRGSAATALKSLRDVSREVTWNSNTNTLTVIFPRYAT